MTLSKYSLDYTSCSIEELRKFIADRTGTATTEAKDSTVPPRRTLVKTLRKLDENASFALMDPNFPAKMRNLCYEHMLASDEPQLEISRVSKQVYREAHDLLLKTRTLPIVETITRYGRETTRPRTKYPLRTADAREALKHAHNIYIKLTLGFRPVYGHDHPIIEEIATAVQAFLKEMRKQFMKAKTFTVEIKFISRDPVTQAAKLLILRPLTMLPEDCNLEFKGLSDAEEKAFWRAAADVTKKLEERKKEAEEKAASRGKRKDGVERQDSFERQESFKKGRSPSKSGGEGLMRR